MSPLIIHPHSAKQFLFFPFFPVDKIDIHRTVRRKYLNNGEKLTRDKALTIFRDMKWKSNIKAFLLHPVILLSGGALCVIPCFSVTAVGILDVALRVVCIFGSIVLGAGLDRIMEGRTWELAYIDQSKTLENYISILEKSPGREVELAPLKTENEGWGSTLERMKFWKAHS